MRPPEAEAAGLDAAVPEVDALLSSVADAASAGESVSLAASSGGVDDVGEEAPLGATSPKMRARAAL